MTRRVYPNGVIELVPDAGMTLTDGHSYSKDLLIGLHGNEATWNEISDAEAARRQAEEDEPDITETEALSILLGGAE